MLLRTPVTKAAEVTATLAMTNEPIVSIVVIPTGKNGHRGGDNAGDNHDDNQHDGNYDSDDHNENHIIGFDENDLDCPDLVSEDEDDWDEIGDDNPINIGNCDSDYQRRF